MPKILIDEKLFAHINTDAFLVGSFGLQGNFFSNTIGYLDQYIKHVTTNGGYISKEVTQLFTACSLLSTYEDEILKVRAFKTTLIPVAASIQEQVKALTADNYLLLPGGWSTLSGGHAIIYQFRKDADGDFLFSVHNSGSGLNYHAKRSDKEKELYNPVLTYKIPKDKINDKNFAQFINNLLTPQIPILHKKNKIGPELLYETIFPQLSYLDGKIVADKSEPEVAYTAGQLSGTCTQHSLHAMLKSRFKTLDDYRTFIYHFKAYSLDDYISKLEGIKPQHHGQLTKAIRHQLRLLNLKKSDDPETDLFNSKLKKEHKEKLIGYLATLRSLKSAVKKVTDEAPSVAPKVNTTLAFAIRKPAELIIGGAEEYTEGVIPSVNEINGGSTLLLEMDALIARCTTFAAQGLDHAVFEQLEQFFTQLPLPSPPTKLLSSLLPFYQGLNTEDKTLKFYQKMSQLQKIYFKSCDDLLGKKTILPRMDIVKLSICAVVGHVNFGRPLIEEGLTPFYSYINGIIHGVAPGCPNAAYLATNDPQLDNRYLQLRELCKDSQRFFVTNSIPTSYYQAIVDTVPDLKTLLERLYLEKYGADNSHIHNVIRAEKSTSLYYLINNFKELQGQFQFAPLLSKFTQQEEIEQLFGYFTKRVAANERYSAGNAPREIRISLPFDTARNTQIEATINNALTLNLQTDVLDSKYGIDGTPAAKALKRDVDELSYTILPRRPDNETQIIPARYADNPDPYCQFTGLKADAKSDIAKLSVDQQALEDRELFHLRRVASTQINLTLDYFNLHPEKLSRHDLQVYVEANLFQPGLLKNLLLDDKKSIPFLKKLDDFIKNGLKYYEKKGLFTQHSLFYIRLSYLINNYAAQLDPLRYRRRQEHFHEELNGHLSCQTDPVIKTTLHRYRLLSIASAYKGTIETPEKVGEALISHFHVEALGNPNHHLDTDSKFQYQCAQRNYKRLLQINKARITDKLLLDIFKNVGIHLETTEGITVSGTYPIFLIASKSELLYTLNVEQGLIFKENLAYKTTPVDILNHPITRKFGLQNQVSSFVSTDGKVLLLDKPPTALRFIKNGGSYRIQKKWPDSSGKERWYELNILSSEQASYWNIPAIQDNKALTKILLERDSLIWKCLDDNHSFLISDSTNKVQYDGTTADWTSEIMVRGTEQRFCQTNSWMHQRLSSFEDPSFINAWATSDSYAIHLERYGLKLNASPTSTVINWSWENLDYQLVEEDTVFDAGIAHLTFKNEKQDICVLPVQPFINGGKRSEHSEYYHLQLDTKAQVPKHAVKELIGKEALQCWQYSGTEQFIVYKVENGQPIPSTPEEALYLCYIYLGSNQPEKAWAVLEDCDKRLGGLAGTYKEVQYLRWIVKTLPYQLDDADEKAIISSPPYVACQLKALSLFTQFSRLDKDIPFPDPVAAASTVNGIFERDVIQNNESFYQNMNSDIYELYSRLQPMRRELPSDYTLSNVETKSLLDYYHKHTPRTEDAPAALGAIGHEWVQLNLNILRQEWDTLDAKLHTRELTAYEQRRKTEIADFLKKHEGVAKLSSKLEYRPIDLSLPPGIDLKTALLPHELNMSLISFDTFLTRLTSEGKKREAIDALVIGISDTVFLKNFPDYIHIATTANHPLQKTLIHFCKATLIAYRHTPLDMQPNNLALLCNILYRLENHPLPQGGYFDKIRSFTQLVTFASQHPIAPIEIPQLYDDTSELLSSAQAIWDNSETPPPVIRPVTLPTSKAPRVKEWLSPELLEFRDDWKVIADRFQTGKGKRAIGETDEERAFAALPKNEYDAGTVKYQSLQAWQSLAKSKLASIGVRTKLKDLCKSKFDALSELQKNLEREIMDLASQGPDDLLLKQQWQIDIAAGIRKAPELNDLLRLYFHADTARYTNNTGLTGGNVNKLHELLTRYVAQGIQSQHCNRVQEQLQQVEKASKDELSHELFVLAKTVCAENGIDVVDEPALSLFQYHGNILLHTQQKEALKRLLTTTAEDQFAETIEKIIMGGGKSKVILPTLAQKKANGNNLVIIEVPRALLRTNYIDLKATSSKLFNQSAYLFEFNRDSNCTAERLEELYNQLTEVMVNKQYMVTAGDSLQSLELKYLELLLQSIPNNEEEAKEWQNQVIWAERLVLLFKHRGDVIIDEVHQGLLLKTKLNYTLGESSTVSKNILKHSTDLYQFFNKVNLGKMTLHEALITRNALIDPAVVSQAMTMLVEQLMSHKDSPLFHELNQLAEGSNLTSIIPIIKKYLFNQGDSIPELIMESTPEIQEKLAFYKEQIAHLLPFTLKRQQGENYGPSKLSSRTPADRMVARPYVANNVPSERSQFGNYLEAINYTIQSTQITGISRDLLRIVLDDWIVQARTEVFAGDAKHLDATIMAAQFRGIAGAEILIPFSQLDPENEEQLSLLHKHLSHNSTLIFNVLKSHILPKIKTNDAILHSDAYSHVDLVHSCQGMSGTPSNHSTFHQRLRFSEDSALGTDSYVLRAIQQKTPTIRAANFTNTASFIDTLFSHYDASAEVRSIIDINASFKGISNLLVAQELVEYVHAHPEKFSLPEPLKYILFFNENNELSALRVQKNSKDQVPIVLGSSDPANINARLNCGPGARFTYYDQAHTIGVDIKQSPKSKGIVLIDQNTQFQNFLQGSMRMRDLLEGSQSIDIIVPTALAKTPFGTLSTMMITNEQRQLQQDNFNAAKAKMTNMLRTDFMQRLLQITGEDAITKKQQFLTVVRHYFVEVQSTNFWEVYGGLDEVKDTKVILTNFHKHLMTDWKRLMVQMEQPIVKEEQKQLAKKMDTIVMQACEPNVCAPKQSTRQNTLSTEVEVLQEKETQIEVLTLKEIEKELYDPSRNPEHYHSWRGEPEPTATLQLKTLTAICQTTGGKEIPVFSSNLLASINFYKCYADQDKFISMYLKPVHALLFKKQKDGSLQCILLTQQEYEDIEESVDKKTDGTCWITTTQHTVLAGAPPLNIRDDKTYQSLIEQARFFNGEFNLLLNRDAPLSWLEEESQQKLDFYTQYLWHCHETSAADVSNVNKLFSVNRKIFTLMSKTPWIDYRKVDWLSRFPSCEKDDIPVFQDLAKALYEATTTCFGPMDLNGQELCSKFNISLGATGYLIRYVEQLNALNTLTKLIKEQCTLSKQEKNPLIVWSKLDKSLVASLISLCPELAKIIANPSSHEDSHVDYDCNMTLMNAIPMCKNHPDLLMACAYNSHINEVQIERLINTSTNNPAVIYGLLTNPSKALTKAHIAKLCEPGVAHDEQTILLLVKHPYLSEDQYPAVVSKAQKLSSKVDILLTLLTEHPSMSLKILAKLIEGQTLNEQHFALILKRPENLEESGLLAVLIKTIPADPEIHERITTIITSRRKDEQLAITIKTTNNSQLIDTCLANPDAKDCAHYEAAKHKSIRTSSLANIAERTTNPIIINAILSRDEMKKPSLNNDLILTALTKNPHLTGIELLDTLVACSFSNEVLKNILTYKKSILNAEVLLHMVKNHKPDDAELAIIAGMPQTNKETLSLIAATTGDIATIFTILGRPEVNDSTDESVYFAIAKNPITSTPVLIDIAAKARLGKTLEEISGRKDVPALIIEEVYLAMAKNLATSMTLLIILAKKSTQPDTLDVILTREDVQKAQNSDIYLAFAKNQATSKAALISIASKTNNTEIFKAILDHKQIKASPDEVYRAITKNPNSPKSILIIVASKTNDMTIIKDLLNRADMQKPSSENDIALTSLAQNPDLVDPELLNQLVSYADEATVVKIILTNKSNALTPKILTNMVTNHSLDEESLSLIAEHPKASPETLARIANKTRKSATIDKILEQDELQNPTDEIQEAAHDTVYIAIAKNPVTTKEALANVAKRASTARTINEILIRPDMKAPSPENNSILSALAKNTNLIETSLVSIMLSLTDDQVVLSNILHYKRSLLDTDVLLKILNKPTLNEKNLYSIAQHKNTPVNALKTIATKKCNHQTITTILEHKDTQAITDELHLLMLNNPELPRASLIYIAKKATTDSTIRALLNRTDMEESNEQNDLVLSVLAENPHVTNADILSTMVSKAYQASTLNSILTLKKDYLNATILSDILSKKGIRNDEVLLIIRDPKTTGSLLKNIAMKTHEPLIITEIIKIIKQKTTAGIDDDNDLVLIALVENHYLTDTASLNSLVDLANKEIVFKSVFVQKHSLINQDTLAKMLEKDPLSEEILLLIAKHPEATRKILTLIASKTHSSETIALILKHKEIEEVFDEICLSLAKDPLTPRVSLVQIATDTEDQSIIKAILERYDMIYGNDENDLVLDALAINPHVVNEDTLSNIAAMAYKSGVMSSLLAHKSDYLNESILVNMMRLTLTDDDYTHIAQHPKATNSILRGIAYDTNNLETINGILNRDDMSEPSEDNDLILRSLAENSNFTNTASINSWISRVHNAATCSYLFEHQNTLLDAPMLTAMLEKKPLHEQLLSHIVMHPEATVDILTEVASLATKHETIALLLKHPNTATSTDDSIYLAVISNPVVSSTTLIDCAEKAHEASTVHQILEQDLEIEPDDCNARVFRTLDSEMLDQIVTFPETDVTRLSNLAEAMPAMRYKILDRLLMSENMNDYKTKNLTQQLIDKEFASILEKIEAARRLPNDQILSDYLSTKKKQIPKIISAEQMKALHKELQNILKIMNSPEVLAINATIARLQSEKPGFFDKDSKDKARNITQAMVAVPLEQRDQIVHGSSTEIKGVQTALAEHRNLFMRIYEYFCKLLRCGKEMEGPLTKEGAAKAYKDLDAAIEEERQNYKKIS